MAVHMSGAHSAPGGEVFATGIRTRDKVLKHPCGCAHTDTAWVQWCAEARREYAEHRAQLRKPEPGLIPGLEDLLA